MKKARVFVVLVLVTMMFLRPESVCAQEDDNIWVSPFYIPINREWVVNDPAFYRLGPTALLDLYQGGEWDGSRVCLDPAGRMIVSASYKGLDYYANVAYYTTTEIAEDDLTYADVPAIMYDGAEHAWRVMKYESEYIPEMGLYLVRQALYAEVLYYFDLPNGKIPSGQSVDMVITLFGLDGVCTWQLDIARLNFWNNGVVVASWDLPLEVLAGGHEVWSTRNGIPYLLTTKYFIVLDHDGYTVVSSNVCGVIHVAPFTLICVQEDFGLCFWNTDEPEIVLHPAR